jgi:hypothetical protein
MHDKAQSWQMICPVFVHGKKLGEYNTFSSFSNVRWGNAHRISLKPNPKFQANSERAWFRFYTIIDDLHQVVTAGPR